MQLYITKSRGVAIVQVPYNSAIVQVSEAHHRPPRMLVQLFVLLRMPRIPRANAKTTPWV